MHPPRNRSWFRRTGRVRISTEKMRRIVRRTLHRLGNDADVNEGTMGPLPLTQTAKMVEPVR